MYKRKNDEPQTMTISWNRMATIALALGLIVLGVATTGTVLWLITVTPTPYPSTYAYPTYPPTKPVKSVIGPVNGGAEIPYLSMSVTRFVISNADGIYVNPDGKGLRHTGLYGVNVVASPDKQSLAYERAAALFVYRGGREQKIMDYARMPAWNPDGNRLAFVVRDNTGDSIYQLNIDSMQPVRLLTVSEIVAPPLSNPATGRLLIVQRTEAYKTAFYSIDPQCATQSACLASRRDIATVPLVVSWADYHPSATTLAFTDRDTGSLYLLSTADGKIEPVVVDNVFKRRPMFSHDGKWLAYLDQNNKLFVIGLDDRYTGQATFSGVISMDWLD